MLLTQAAIDLMEGLALALAIGLLIGIERGWRERDVREGGRTAGMRTFALTGLAGGLCAAALPLAGPVIAVAALASVMAAYLLFKLKEAEHDRDWSITGIVAALCVFLLGFLAVAGDRLVAAAFGVAVTALLAARTSLHESLKRLTWPELRSAIVLLAMTVIALPLLPSGAIDPWGVIHPRELWLVTILIAAISAAGYVAVRLFGEGQGLLFASLVGGLVSSTVVTLANARRARDGWDEDGPAWAAGLANAVSIARSNAIVLAVAPDLALSLARLLVPAAALLAMASLLGWSLASSRERASREFELGNPFEPGAVLRFALLFAGLLIAARIAEDVLGGQGLVGLAAISGLVDVDAITLAAARVSGSIGEETAVLAIVTASGANLLFKAAAGTAIGGVGFGARVLAGAGIAGLGAAIGWFALS